MRLVEFGVLERRIGSARKLDTLPSSSSFWRRLAAIGYDAVLLSAVLFMLTLVLVAVREGRTIPPGSPWYTLVLLSMCFFYFTWSWVRGGQTLGMRVWRLVLVRSGWWSGLVASGEPAIFRRTSFLGESGAGFSVVCGRPQGFVLARQGVQDIVGDAGGARDLVSWVQTCVSRRNSFIIVARDSAVTLFASGNRSWPE
ncbi:MAG: RDD family protein [Gammaproteobacteria bacterium]